MQKPAGLIPPRSLHFVKLSPQSLFHQEKCAPCNLHVIPPPNEETHALLAHAHHSPNEDLHTPPKKKTSTQLGMFPEAKTHFYIIHPTPIAANRNSMPQHMFASDRQQLTSHKLCHTGYTIKIICLLLPQTFVGITIHTTCRCLHTKNRRLLGRCSPAIV